MRRKRFVSFGWSCGRRLSERSALFVCLVVVCLLVIYLLVVLAVVVRDQSKLAIEHAVNAIQNVVNTTGRRGVAMFFAEEVGDRRLAGAVRAEQLLNSDAGKDGGSVGVNKRRDRWDCFREYSNTLEEEAYKLTLCVSQSLTNTVRVQCTTCKLWTSRTNSP